MSVSLHTMNETGRHCPKCGNASVFTTKFYKYLGMVYSHSESKCEMGICDYKEKDMSAIRDNKLKKLGIK